MINDDKYRENQIYEGKPCPTCGGILWVYGIYFFEPDGYIVGFKCFGCDEVIRWTEDWEEDFMITDGEQ